MKTCFAAILSLAMCASSAFAQDLGPPEAARKPKDVSVHDDPVYDVGWFRIHTIGQLLN